MSDLLNDAGTRLRNARSNLEWALAGANGNSQEAVNRLFESNVLLGEYTDNVELTDIIDGDTIKVRNKESNQEYVVRMVDGKLDYDTPEKDFKTFSYREKEGNFEVRQDHLNYLAQRLGKNPEDITNEEIVNFNNYAKQNVLSTFADKDFRIGQFDPNKQYADISGNVPGIELNLKSHGVDGTGNRMAAQVTDALGERDITGYFSLSSEMNTDLSTSEIRLDNRLSVVKEIEDSITNQLQARKYGAIDDANKDDLATTQWLKYNAASIHDEISNIGTFLGFEPREFDDIAREWGVTSKTLNHVDDLNKQAMLALEQGDMATALKLGAEIAMWELPSEIVPMVAGIGALGLAVKVASKAEKLDKAAKAFNLFDKSRVAGFAISQLGVMPQAMSQAGADIETRSAEGYSTGFVQRMKDLAAYQVIANLTNVSAGILSKAPKTLFKDSKVFDVIDKTNRAIMERDSATVAKGFQLMKGMFAVAGVSLTEGVQEGLENAYSRLTTDANFDATDIEDVTKYFEGYDAFLGGMVGGAVATPIQLVRGLMDYGRMRKQSSVAREFKKHGIDPFNDKTLPKIGDIDAEELFKEYRTHLVSDEATATDSTATAQGTDASGQPYEDLSASTQKFYSVEETNTAVSGSKEDVLNFIDWGNKDRSKDQIAYKDGTVVKEAEVEETEKAPIISKDGTTELAIGNNKNLTLEQKELLKGVLEGDTTSKTTFLKRVAEDPTSTAKEKSIAEQNLKETDRNIDTAFTPVKKVSSSNSEVLFGRSKEDSFISLGRNKIYSAKRIVANILRGARRDSTVSTPKYKRLYEELNNIIKEPEKLLTLARISPTILSILTERRILNEQTDNPEVAREAVIKLFNTLYNRVNNIVKAETSEDINTLYSKASTVEGFELLRSLLEDVDITKYIGTHYLNLKTSKASEEELNAIEDFYYASVAAGLIDPTITKLGVRDTAEKSKPTSTAEATTNSSQPSTPAQSNATASTGASINIADLILDPDALVDVSFEDMKSLLREILADNVKFPDKALNFLQNNLDKMNLSTNERNKLHKQIQNAADYLDIDLNNTAQKSSKSTEENNGHNAISRETTESKKENATVQEKQGTVKEEEAEKPNPVSSLSKKIQDRKEEPTVSDNKDSQDIFDDMVTADKAYNEEDYDKYNEVPESTEKLTKKQEAFVQAQNTDSITNTDDDDPMPPSSSAVLKQPEDKEEVRNVLTKTATAFKRVISKIIDYARRGTASLDKLQVHIADKNVKKEIEAKLKLLDKDMQEVLTTSEIKIEDKQDALTTYSSYHTAVLHAAFLVNTPFDGTRTYEDYLSAIQRAITSLERIQGNKHSLNKKDANLLTMLSEFHDNMLLKENTDDIEAFKKEYTELLNKINETFPTLVGKMFSDSEKALDDAILLNKSNSAEKIIINALKKSESNQAKATNNDMSEEEKAKSPTVSNIKHLFERSDLHAVMDILLDEQAEDKDGNIFDRAKKVNNSIKLMQKYKKGKNTVADYFTFKDSKDTSFYNDPNREQKIAFINKLLSNVKYLNEFEGKVYERNGVLSSLYFNNVLLDDIISNLRTGAKGSVADVYLSTKTYIGTNNTGKGVLTGGIDDNIAKTMYDVLIEALIDVDGTNRIGTTKDSFAEYVSYVDNAGNSLVNSHGMVTQITSTMGTKMLERMGVFPNTKVPGEIYSELAIRLGGIALNLAVENGAVKVKEYHNGSRGIYAIEINDKIDLARKYKRYTDIINKSADRSTKDIYNKKLKEVIDKLTKAGLKKEDLDLKTSTSTEHDFISAIMHHSSDSTVINSKRKLGLSLQAKQPTELDYVANRLFPNEVSEVHKHNLFTRNNTPMRVNYSLVDKLLKMHHAGTLKAALLQGDTHPDSDLLREKAKIQGYQVEYDTVVETLEYLKANEKEFKGTDTFMNSSLDFTTRFHYNSAVSPAQKLWRYLVLAADKKPDVEVGYDYDISQSMDKLALGATLLQGAGIDLEKISMKERQDILQRMLNMFGMSATYGPNNEITYAIKDNNGYAEIQTFLSMIENNTPKEIEKYFADKGVADFEYAQVSLVDGLANTLLSLHNGLTSKSNDVRVFLPGQVDETTSGIMLNALLFSTNYESDIQSIIGQIALRKAGDDGLYQDGYTKLSENVVDKAGKYVSSIFSSLDVFNKNPDYVLNEINKVIPKDISQDTRKLIALSISNIVSQEYVNTPNIKAATLKKYADDVISSVVAAAPYIFNEIKRKTAKIPVMSTGYNAGIESVAKGLTDETLDDVIWLEIEQTFKDTEGKTLATEKDFKVKVREIMEYYRSCKEGASIPEADLSDENKMRMLRLGGILKQFFTYGDMDRAISGAIQHIHKRTDVDINSILDPKSRVHNERVVKNLYRMYSELMGINDTKQKDPNQIIVTQAEQPTANGEEKKTPVTLTQFISRYLSYTAVNGFYETVIDGFGSQYTNRKVIDSFNTHKQEALREIAHRFRGRSLDDIVKIMQHIKVPRSTRFNGMFVSSVKPGGYANSTFVESNFSDTMTTNIYLNNVDNHVFHSLDTKNKKKIGKGTNSISQELTGHFFTGKDTGTAVSGTFLLDSSAASDWSLQEDDKGEPIFMVQVHDAVYADARLSEIIVEATNKFGARLIETNPYTDLRNELTDVLMTDKHMREKILVKAKEENIHYYEAAQEIFSEGRNYSRIRNEFPKKSEQLDSANIQGLTEEENAIVKDFNNILYNSLTNLSDEEVTTFDTPTNINKSIGQVLKNNNKADNKEAITRATIPKANPFGLYTLHKERNEFIAESKKRGYVVALMSSMLNEGSAFRAEPTMENVQKFYDAEDTMRNIKDSKEFMVNQNNVDALVDYVAAIDGTTYSDTYLARVKSLLKSMLGTEDVKTIVTESDNLTGHYSINTDQVNLFYTKDVSEEQASSRELSGATALEVLTHELSHAVFYKAMHKDSLEANPKLREIYNELKALQEDVRNTYTREEFYEAFSDNPNMQNKETLDKMYDYIFTDNEANNQHSLLEFVALAVSNNKFMDSLSKHRLEGKNFVDRFMRVVKNFLKMFFNFEALKDFMPSVVDLFNQTDYKHRNKDFFYRTQYIIKRYDDILSNALGDHMRMTEAVDKIAEGFKKLIDKVDKPTAMLNNKMLNKLSKIPLPRSDFNNGVGLKAKFFKVILLANMGNTDAKALLEASADHQELNAAGFFNSSAGFLFRDLTGRNARNKMLNEMKYFQRHKNRREAEDLTEANNITSSLRRAFGFNKLRKFPAKLNNTLYALARLDISCLVTGGELTPQRLEDKIDEVIKLITNPDEMYTIDLARYIQESTSLTLEDMNLVYNLSSALSSFLVTGNSSMGLLKSAKAIAEEVGLENDAMFVNLIDRYVTTEAFRAYHDNGAFDGIADNLKDNRKNTYNGLREFIKIQKMLSDRYKEKNIDKTTVKGYIEDIPTYSNDTRVISNDLEEIAKYTKEGYIMVDDKFTDSSVVMTKKYIFKEMPHDSLYNIAAVKQAYMRIEEHNAITGSKYDEESIKAEIDEVYAKYREKIIPFKYQTNAKVSENPFALSRPNKGNAFVKVVRADGTETYGIDINKSILFDTVAQKGLFDMAATMGDTSKAVNGTRINYDFNSIITDALTEASGKINAVARRIEKETGEFNGIYDGKHYIKIGDIPQKIPYITLLDFMDRDTVEQLSGLWIDSEIVHLVFGSSVKGFKNTELFNSQREMPRKVLAAIDDLWKFLVKTAKVNIYIKNPVVIIGNILSNVAAEVGEGGNVAKVLPKYIRAVRDLSKYLGYKDELSQLKFSKNKGEAVDENRIAELERLMKANNVHYFATRSSFLSTVVEDTAVQATRSRNSIERNTSNMWYAMPAAIRTPFEFLYMGSNTSMFKALEAVTMYTDVVSKMSLYEKNKADGMTHEENLTHVDETFIDYEAPMGTVGTNVDEYGLMMFTRFVRRVQPVITRAAKNHPAYTMLIAASMAYGLPFEVIFDMFLPYYLFSNSSLIDIDNIFSSVASLNPVLDLILE